MESTIESLLLEPTTWIFYVIYGKVSMKVKSFVADHRGYETVFVQNLHIFHRKLVLKFNKELESN